MNIFYLDPRPLIAAKYHCDKHIPKMILETCQLLFTKHWAKIGYKPGENPLEYYEVTKKYKKEFNDCPKVYKPTHWNHPSSIWVRQSDKHYEWLLELGKGLLFQYTERYEREHACTGIISWMSLNLNVDISHPYIEPPQCMPDQYKSNDTVKSYQNYYIYEKSRFAKWDRAKKGTPKWFKHGIENLMDSQTINGLFIDGISVTMPGNNLFD